MLEDALARLEPITGKDNQIIATTPILKDSTAQLVGPKLRIFAEPHKRNTAGCLVWAVAKLLAADEASANRTSMAIVAADHRITPVDGFVRTVEKALDLAETTGALVTIGIRPTRPETGYGYIELGEVIDRDAYKVGTFHEKPTRERAEQYLGSGNFLWNSGMFFWTIPSFMSALQTVAIDLHDTILTIAAALREGNEPAAEKTFFGLRNVSIDYALMERAPSVAVVEADFAWDDLGSWDALPRALPQDNDRNVSYGDVILLGSENNIVWNDIPGSTICLLEVDDLVVVQTSDATLICPTSRAQEVRRAVEAMQAKHAEKT